MSDGGVIRAQLYAAAEKADEAVTVLQNSESEMLDKLTTNLVAASSATEAAMRAAQLAVRSIEESYTTVNSAVVGSGDRRVSDGIAMLNEAAGDQIDMIVKLRFLLDELETLRANVVAVAINDKNNDVQKISSAASHFRGYAAEIP